MPEHTASTAPPPQRRRRFRLAFWVSLLLAALVAYLSPAAPALLRYGALPHAPGRTRSFVLAGVTPEYVGYHTRAPEDYGGLADTIALVQLRAGERKLQLLNIPRDTWTDIPGWGMGKINSANVRGGMASLERAAAQLTGLPVEGSVLLSLEALRDVTNAAGGVTLTVARPMKYQDTAAGLNIDLSPGRQHLSGAQAEAYVRFRHDGLGDIGRVERQQGFLHALADKLLSPLGWWYAPGVIGALAQNIRTDLSRDDVAAVLGALARRPQIETVLLPGSFGPGGTWTPDRAQIRQLARGPFAPETLPGDPRALRVAVVNVGAPGGSARRLKARLEALGYRNVWAVTGSGDAGTTVVLAADRRAAERLRGDVGYGAVKLQGTGEPGADLTVRLGADTPAK